MPFADELGMWASRVIDEETVHVRQSETFPDRSLDLWKTLSRHSPREDMRSSHSIQNRIGGIPFVNVNW